MTVDGDRPRLMTKAEAAAYCRLTPDGFATWVRLRIVPGPIEGTRRWDRLALDRALDRLSGITDAPVPVETPLQRWCREKRERRAKRP